ncbi:MAG: hypothetical protein LJE94_10950 [Deltaproteobacteria bacterium]|jgi:hypothetical protein|nr:hypothetical protein [Deltaproteobacteria bacterium]
METPIDIRDRETITHEDVLALNFIRNASRYRFRGHFTEGLRSRIIQLLDPEDVANETKGIVTEGVRRYPLARPIKMLRIFRRPFNSLVDIEDEIVNYKIIQKYLPAAYFAASSEFIVHYEKPDGSEIVLCGLQEYVEGETLDPWNPDLIGAVKSTYSGWAPRDHQDPWAFAERKTHVLQQHAKAFIKYLKKMIRASGRIPDLAGVGNLLFTRSATIHLVDINNISTIDHSNEIPIDDKGYPACDKSIESLFLLERNLLGRPVDAQSDPYLLFLSPERMQRVREIEKKFHASIANRGGYPLAGMFY